MACSAAENAGSICTLTCLPCAATVQPLEMLTTSFIMLWNSLVACTGLALISVATAQSPALPVVDLGYERHQASFFNVCHTFILPLESRSNISVCFSWFLFISVYLYFCFMSVYCICVRLNLFISSVSVSFRLFLFITHSYLLRLVSNYFHLLLFQETSY